MKNILTGALALSLIVGNIPFIANAESTNQNEVNVFSTKQNIDGQLVNYKRT